MKRTNLLLPDELLDEAMRLSGVKTYSALVESALREFVRRLKARQIFALKGSGAWRGDLAEMRDDRPVARHKRRRRA
jgi:Arc/MetJ family transcription regulator